MSNPASGGTVAKESNLDSLPIIPVVYINGKAIDYAFCTRIEDSTGLKPARAMIQLGANDLDFNQQITLNAVDWSKDWKIGSRVAIKDSTSVYFLGMISKRMDQGENNSIQWEAISDAHLLNFLPMNGAFVYDPNTGLIEYAPRFPMHCNPQGKANCILVPSNDALFPMFLPRAYDKGTYSEADTDTDETPMKVCYWTPKRVLQYLQYRCVTSKTEVWNPDAWRSLVDSKRLKWYEDANKFPASASEMFVKLPDTNFHGKSVAAVMKQLMQETGILSFRFDLNGDITTVNPYIKYPDTSDMPSKGLVINLQRSEEIADANNAFDFELEEDGTDALGSFLTEGAPVRLEMSAEYDPDNESTSLIVPAWTADEESGAKSMLGGIGDHIAIPAKIPNFANNETWAGISWVEADGSGDRPHIEKNTQAAIQHFRKLFPRVWCGYKLNGAAFKTRLLNEGINNTFKDAPFITVTRECLHENLQHVIGYDGSTTLRHHFPIRVELWNDTNSKYQDAVANDGLAIDSNGILMLRGLTDDLQSEDLLYVGSLLTAPDSVVNRKIRITVTFPLDIRTKGYVENVSADFDAGYMKDAVGGAPIGYYDAGNSYVTEQQYQSNPSSAEAYPKVTGTGTDSAPLTRTLRDDSSKAKEDAGRKLRRRCNPTKSSYWKIVGIRPEYRAGRWIDSVKITGGTQGETTYTILSYPDSVLFDFLSQATTIGGMLHSE